MGRAKPKPRPAARANTRTRPTGRPPAAAAKPPAPAAKPPTAAAKPPASITPADIVQALPEVTEQAEQVAAGGALPEPPEASGTVDGVSLTRLWRDVMQIKLAYEHAHTRLTEQQQHADADQAALSLQQRAWEQQRGEWDAQRAEADQRAATAEKDLRQRRADNDERDERLADLELRLAQQEADTRSAASNAVREALASERAALAQERDELSQQREKLRRRDTELRAREEDLQDWDELFEQRLQIGIQRATEQQKLRLAALEQRHTDLLAENQRLEGELTEYGRIQRAFPDFDPERVLAEQRLVEEEVRDLRGRQPRADVLADLTRLREESQRWQEDRSFLLAETERLQLQLSAYQVTAFELDRQEAVKQALQATAEAYKDEVQRLRDQADGLRRRAEGISPFPECSKMDEEYQQARDDLTRVLPPLAKFVRWLRHYIAQQDGLFYSEADLRLFLAGLAATRLHLLQGVSGIGKTQLPLAVAKAIGAAAVPVAVGADWRTPQDLTGYYNAFERRFYESEFTQAVYQAGCPAFLAQPFFVVLDEMNLSHPEQYFSAVLSALEIRKKGAAGQMTVELMTTEVQPSPRGLIQGRPAGPSAQSVVHRHGQPRRDHRGLRRKDFRPVERAGTARPTGRVPARAHGFAGCHLGGGTARNIRSCRARLANRADWAGASRDASRSREAIPQRGSGPASLPGLSYLRRPEEHETPGPVRACRLRGRRHGPRGRRSCAGDEGPAQDPWPL